ncbi:MAG TPA: rRNA maturation RNase YbeY [Anditalea sp.]|nr:rRNA maturation RNase YbeY [Anditalea sp.]
MAVNFFVEDISFKFQDKNKYKKWLRSLASHDGFNITDLNYIFCSDEYLYQMNVDYLDHDTYTDIITFDNSEEEKDIEGDIFISIPRVKENAHSQDIEFSIELKRVLAHGILHLMGYRDKSSEEINAMRKMEDFGISIFPNEN